MNPTEHPTPSVMSERVYGIQFRPVYTTEQFAAEILCGHRSAEWVRDQCRIRRIKTVTRRPYLISAAEARRFLQIPPEATVP